MTIWLLHGDNEFCKRQRLAELLTDNDLVERADGLDLNLVDLQDILQGQTLFTNQRTVVINNLSESPVWVDLPEVATATETQLILLETKVDKRTKTYKWLKKQAKVEEFKSWGERDQQTAIKWLIDRAKQEYDFNLNNKLAATIVERLGLDQLRLDSLLAQLSLADKIDAELIDLMLPLPKSESIFGLMEMTLQGRRQEVRDIIRYLELTSGADGAYQAVGLLASQIAIINALVLGASQQEVISELGAHPFVVQKLVPLARNLTIDDLRTINREMSEADLSTKTTNAAPWLLLEAALVAIMSR